MATFYTSFFWVVWIAWKLGYLWEVLGCSRCMDSRVGGNHLRVMWPVLWMQHDNTSQSICWKLEEKSRHYQNTTTTTTTTKKSNTMDTSSSGHTTITKPSPPSLTSPLSGPPQLHHHYHHHHHHQYHQHFGQHTQHHHHPHYKTIPTKFTAKKSRKPRFSVSEDKSKSDTRHWVEKRGQAISGHCHQGSPARA